MVEIFGGLRVGPQCVALFRPKSLLATCCSQPIRFIIESVGDELAQPTHYVYKKKCQILTTTRGLETLKWFKKKKTRPNAKGWGAN
jgi:hypothetical protein